MNDYEQNLIDKSKMNTTVGLPNTCAICAQPIDPDRGWLVEHIDAAKCGQGICHGHGPKPKTTRRRRSNTKQPTDEAK